MNKDQMPDGMPNVSLTEYAVPVRLLLTAKGRVLMETQAQIRARFAAATHALQLEYIDQKEEFDNSNKTRMALRNKQLEIYAKIEKERAADIRQFVFRFRTAKGRDVAAAEAKAAIAPPAEGEAPPELASIPISLRSAYRLELAKRTLIGHDWPGDFPQTDADFNDLDSDVSEYVLSKVAERVHFSQDIFNFLET